jgi:hypothetical protein
MGFTEAGSIVPEINMTVDLMFEPSPSGTLKVYAFVVLSR